MHTHRRTRMRTHRHRASMDANDVEGRGQLIPELPEELVLAHVVPRLPWYTRPVCRTLSKSWRALIDTRNPELDLRTCTIQLPLLRGLFLFCTSEKEIFISDFEMKGTCRMNEYQVQPHWRKLPPLPSITASLPIRATMVASSGMVYWWFNHRSYEEFEEGGHQTFVLKLDIGRADCTWKKCFVPCDFNARAVAFNGSIYVPQIYLEVASAKTAVFVHDMSTDTCKQVEKWVQDDLSVFSRSTESGALVEEMYGIVEEKFPAKLEVVKYDVVLDSWGTWEEVPFPELLPLSRLVLVKLLNAECLEPVSETGTNFICVVGDQQEGVKFLWFNSSDGNSWVHIDYAPHMEEMYMDSLKVMRGSMYAIFTEGERSSEDGLANVRKRVIMKGRIGVASKSVVWELVHEIGLFNEDTTTMVRLTTMA